MPPVDDKLTASQEILKELQEDGQRIFLSSALSRTHRDRLKRAGFVVPVIKGWWMAANPATRPGDTTAWYASFWEFCARYSTSRFGEAWHLSPETSLLIHAEATDVPRQVVIHTPRGTNHTIDLPFETSLFDYQVGSIPDPAHLTERDGLRMLTPAAALVRVQPSFFQRRPAEAQVALAGVRDPSDLLVQLLEEDRTVIAGRLVGGLRRIGRQALAGEIADTMAQAGHRVRESDPFDTDRPLPQIQPRTPALVGRMQTMWEAMPALFDLLRAEDDPAVRAVLGHWLFGYIHPFLDGNGRVARFLMNPMLASGGYPWTVIRTEERDEYMSALEAASVDQDIGPFAALIARAVNRAVGEFE